MSILSIDRTTRARILSILSHDLPASLVVFLVAVPLSMGIAQASGAPILSGLTASAVGGIVVGILGGVPFQVTGPAAGLSVIVFGLVQQFGFAGVCAITVGAGLIQMLLGALGAARITLAISPAVIHGMLAGIGVLIFMSQVHIVLGGAPESSFWRNLAELPEQIADLHGAATALGLLTIAIFLVWPLIPVSRLRRVPAALVAVVLATAVSVLAGADVPRVTLPDNILGALHLPAWPAGSPGDILGAVLALAIVASAESLLCAVATDKLHAGPRANLGRELVAQGVANALCGMAGGLPVTGVIVRSTANIDAGARTRLSAVLHGVWVLLFVTQLGFLVTRIPLSVLAGLLVVIGTKLVNIAHIRALVRHREGPVYFVTLAGVVGINLLVGIGIGIVAVVLQLLWRMTRVHIEVTRHGARWHVTVRGALTFLSVPALSARLSAIPPGTQVDVDLAVDFMDHAAFEALHAWRVSHERTGGQVDLDAIHEVWTERHPGSPPAAAGGEVPRRRDL